MRECRPVIISQVTPSSGSLACSPCYAIRNTAQMHKPLLFILLATASVTACAQQPTTPAAAKVDAAKPAPAAVKEVKAAPGSADERVVKAIKSLDPQIKVEHIAPAPISGFREVIVGGQVVYISDDGKYMFQGSLFDLAQKKNLADVTMSKVRRDLLKEIPASDRIVFAPPNPKYTVTIFTDVECGYCRKLHSEIADINKQGIAVEYLAFPRMGIGTPDYDKMVAVWCAPDRKKALTDAKNDRKVAAGKCANPVANEYNYGQRIGLTGTPMIIAEDGAVLGGYLPPAQLRAALDKNAGPAKAGSR